MLSRLVFFTLKQAMRIIITLVLSFLSFFLTGDIISRVAKRFVYSYPGLLMCVLGFISIFFGKYLLDEPLDIFLAFTLIGAGLGLTTHHILYKGFLFSRTAEHKFINKHERAIDRWLEKIPGIITWLALTSPFWLGLLLPFAVAYLIIIASFYWLFSSIKIAISIYIGYNRFSWAAKQLWLERLKQDFPNEWNKYYHLLVVPTYKESFEVLKPGFDAVVNLNYPKERIFLAVGFEERANPEVTQANTIKYLKDLSKKIGGVFITIHPSGLPGEINGPGTNRNWVVRSAAKEFQNKGINPEKVIVTTLDADFVIHHEFLSGALHKYLSLPKEVRQKRSLTGVFLYYNNYWQTPTPMRLMAIGTSFWQLAEMVASDKYQHFSSFSINMKSLLDVGLWIPDKVNDDSGFYWKAYYHFAGNYKIIPHYLPIYADAVLDTTLAKTFVNQYQQLKRWAYGIEHFPFVVKNFFRRSDIDFWNKTDKLTFTLWANLKWTALALFINFAGLIIGVVNPQYNQSVISINLPVVSSWILTAAFLGLSATIYVHEKTVPQRPKYWSLPQKVWSYLQWLFVPLVLITIATIPAIDAQTTLMFGRHLEYRTTNKARPNQQAL